MFSQQVLNLSELNSTVESLLHRLHSEDDTTSPQKQKIEKATELLISSIKEKISRQEKKQLSPQSSPRKGRKPKSPVKHAEFGKKLIDEKIFKNLELGAEETSTAIKKLQTEIPKTQTIAENITKVLNENFGKPESSVEKTLKKRKVTESHSKNDKSLNATPSRTRKRLSSIQ